MVAKISVGNSLYGAIAYNGEKINEAQGRLLTTNRIYNDGSGTVDISKAMEGFHTFLPPQRPYSQGTGTEVWIASGRTKKSGIG